MISVWVCLGFCYFYNETVVMNFLERIPQNSDRGALLIVLDQGPVNFTRLITGGVNLGLWVKVMPSAGFTRAKLL